MEIGFKGKCLTGLMTAGMVSAMCMLPAFAAEKLEAPETAEWSTSVETKATWDKVENANGYQVRLYFNDEYIKTIDSKTTRIDLADYMTTEGWYHFEVRAVVENKNGVKDPDWESSDYTSSEAQKIENLGNTDGTWKNYVDGKKYQKADGSLVKSQWYRILGKWYCFDDEGYMVTGWKKDGNNWYYLNSEGTMETGWLLDGTKWYYLDEDGVMKTGWFMANPGQWYYLNADGSMAADTVVDGYYLSSSGVWIP